MSLTLVYYTANRIKHTFAEKIRSLLLRSADGLPIVSVSQKPLEFGRNLCVGELGPSPYHLYRQVLEGARLARTRYVACVEDDTLYPGEHFLTLPKTDEAFYYNINRHWLESRGVFRWRRRCSLLACVVCRDLLIETLEARFTKHPEHPPGREAWRTFGEPGRVENLLGLPVVDVATYQTRHPIVTVNHRDSLGGKRRTSPSDSYCQELEPWGPARELWDGLMQ